MKIGFIFPSSDYLFDPFRGDPHTHFQILTVLGDRLGKGVELALIDLRGIARHFAIYHIPQCDLYLHSVYTLDFAEQVSLVGQLKARFPKSKHVAGGPHAALFQDASLEVFDSLVLGDGEEQIIKIVNDLSANKLKRVYIEENLLDINQYPVPRRDFLPETAVARTGLMTLKHRPGFDKLVGTTVVFSRGCPYNCHFCAISQVRRLSPSIRFRSPNLITREIESLKLQYGIEGMSILDEIGIPMEIKQARAHLDAIGQAGIIWRAQCRVGGVTEETARLTAQAGCITMCLGVESVNQLSLDIINKKIEVVKAEESIRLIKANGMECRVYLILGLPGEPADIVEKTWSFIQRTSPDIVYLSLLTIRPGTELYNHPDRFGIKWINRDWSKTMHMHSRYVDEVPELTFAYAENTPWGPSLSNEAIVRNYLELQTRLREASLVHV